MRVSQFFTSNRKLDQKGFGLLGVIIAAAILMIVIIAVSRATVDSLYRYRQFSQSNESERIVSMIRDALSSDRACGKTFNVQPRIGAAPGRSHALPTQGRHFDIEAILAANGKVIADKTPFDSGIVITRFEVMPLYNNDTVSNLDDGVTYLGQLKIYFRKTNIGAGLKAPVEGGVGDTQRVIPITFEKDATNVNFQTCVSGKSIVANDIVWILHHAAACVGSTALVGIDASGNPVCARIPNPPLP